MEVFEMCIRDRSGTGGGEADSNGFRYNGQYTDEETGLILSLIHI